MPAFKCKMCGGSLEIQEGMTVCECEYCGTKQTLPKLTDDKKANMYDRANHFRRNNEFDKAMGIYEQILNEDATDAETYWSIVLCRYGIEYVEDPATKKQIPTVNRAQYTSIFDDEDYKSAISNADTLQKGIYEDEARTINEIQKNILEISQKEEPFDVFICYKETDNNGRRTQDSVLATDLYHQLMQEGFKVFFSRITLEDKLGTAYEPYIFAALNSAKVMVVLGTKPEYFQAVWVRNEWSRYLALVKQSGGKKMLIPAYRDMDPYDLPEEFSHLQAQDMGKLGFMQDLIRGIKKILQADRVNSSATETIRETVVMQGGESGNVAALLKRAFMFLEDGDFNSANEYCERVLDIDPENAEAYLGKLMVVMHVRRKQNLANCWERIENKNDYQKVMRFGSDELKAELESYNIQVNKKVDEENERRRKEKAEEKRREKEKRKREEEQEKLYEKFEHNGTVITRYIGDSKNVKIPDGCTGIGDKTFADCARLISVTIPNSVTSIGSAAFQSCSGLTSIILPDSVTSIGSAAFQSCSGLTSIILPDSVTSIGRNAFGNCSGLTNIRIPSSVTSIESATFCDCSGLRSISIPGGVTSIGSSAFYRCSGLTSIVLPDSVTSIGSHAFYGCSRLTSIILSDSVTSIGEFAFYECRGLISISIPGSVTSIGLNAFQECSGLTKLRFCGDVPKIQDWIMYDSYLKKIIVPKTYIEKYKKLINNKDLIKKFVHKVRIIAVQEYHTEEEKQRRRIELNSEKTSLESELASLKGMFTGKRRNEITERLEQISDELSTLEKINTGTGGGSMIMPSAPLPQTPPVNTAPQGFGQEKPMGSQQPAMKQSQPMGSQQPAMKQEKTMGSQQPAMKQSQPMGSQQQPAMKQSQPMSSQQQSANVQQGQSASTSQTPPVSPAPQTAPIENRPMPQLLHEVQKGQKVSVPITGTSIVKCYMGWNVTNPNCDVDISAFLLNASGKVLGDNWFVFYGQNTSPDGSTVFREAPSPDREMITIELSKLDANVTKIVFVLTINEALEKQLNFSMIKDAYIRLIDAANNTEYVSFKMTEYYANVNSMMIGELYLYKGNWKFSAVGNGVARDLAGLCELYGVQVV